jgi:hypothetical protein
MPDIRDKLRVICHSLRMQTWDGLDPFALADLHSRIRKLPSAEKISAMAASDLEGLRKRLDRLLFDIDRHDNIRSKSRAVRYQADTNLPPRRKPLVAGSWYGLSKTASAFYKDDETWRWEYDDILSVEIDRVRPEQGEHFSIAGSCGHTIQSCRCSSPSKKTYALPVPCMECKKK